MRFFHILAFRGYPPRVQEFGNALPLLAKTAVNSCVCVCISPSSAGRVTGKSRRAIVPAVPLWIPRFVT